MTAKNKKKIAILGSTGSIGCQALEVIRMYPAMFSVEVLTANFNADLLIQQAIQFQPNAVVIADNNSLGKVRSALASHPVKVYSGPESVEQIVEMGTIDLVLVALVGFAGLKPVVKALKAGRRIALSTKEVMVVAGSLVNELAGMNKTWVLPVDSEHSAIMQCLAGEHPSAVEKIILTASGGPFRTTPAQDLSNATRNDALKHPNWEMGNKITIDSATLMNKGFEAIEARWFFHLLPHQIEVVIHPQSVVHSLVQFHDGSVKAQLGLPDMKVPILYALSFPERLATSFPRLNLAETGQLTFEPPDFKKFRNLALAFYAMEKGGNMPCVLNAANEVVVEAFLNDRIGFGRMPQIIEKVMEKMDFLAEPGLEDLCLTDLETRKMTNLLLIE